VDQDIASEKAATFGRLTRAFEAALAAYNALPDVTLPDEQRTALIKLADALYALSILREAMGLRDTERLMKDYRVPRAVRAYMGVGKGKCGS